MPRCGGPAAGIAATILLVSRARAHPSFLFPPFDDEIAGFHWGAFLPISQPALLEKPPSLSSLLRSATWLSGVCPGSIIVRSVPSSTTIPLSRFSQARATSSGLLRIPSSSDRSTSYLLQQRAAGRSETRTNQKGQNKRSNMIQLKRRKRVERRRKKEKGGLPGILCGSDGKNNK